MTRTETDSLGSIEIDADRCWGPQTERALRLFRIGVERFPPVLIRAVGLQKQASAEANQALGELAADVAGPIAAAAAAIAAGQRDAEFPLPVWQTGSGTQTNMNANEVIATLANEALGQPRGSRSPVHPNDHVNRGQSSNDSFPTAMHIAAAFPKALNEADLDEGEIERERAIATEKAAESGKPADIIAKMVEGGIAKYRKEHALVSQLFVMDGKTKISDVVAKAGKDAGAEIKLVDYVRFQLGEGIEKETSDFAAEVAAAVAG